MIAADSLIDADYLDATLVGRRSVVGYAGAAGPRIFADGLPKVPKNGNFLPFPTELKYCSPQHFHKKKKRERGGEKSRKRVVGKKGPFASRFCE